MNDSVGSRIKELRERKNFSQEAMAIELEITQSNYGRLEKLDSRITVPKLLKIANMLEVSIAYLFNENTDKSIIQQANSDSAHVISSEVIKSVTYSDKEHIASLKEEIEYLRELLKNKL